MAVTASYIPALERYIDRYTKYHRSALPDVLRKEMSAIPAIFHCRVSGTCGEFNSPTIIMECNYQKPSSHG